MKRSPYLQGGGDQFKVENRPFPKPETSISINLDSKGQETKGNTFQLIANNFFILGSERWNQGNVGRGI